jgi:hypothetical protein
MMMMAMTMMYKRADHVVVISCYGVQRKNSWEIAAPSDNVYFERAEYYVGLLCKITSPILWITATLVLHTLHPENC